MAIEDSKTGKRTVAEAIADGAFLSAEQAAAAAFQLLEFLGTLHSEGRIHRKIIPETVHFTNEMRFSLEPVEAEVSLGGIGPEVIPCPPPLQNGRPLLLPADIQSIEHLLTQSGILLDPRQIDFYQLGALLCYMVCGHDISDYLRSCRAKADVPKLLQPIINTALGLNHNDSFSSGTAFSDALESFINRGPNKKTDFSQLPESIFAESQLRSIPVTTPSNDSKPTEEGQLPFEMLGHYKIIECIGHGGMGDVYKAYEEPLGRFVAIKVLPAELSRQKDFVKRFQVEAAAIAQLDHPNVVRIYYCGSVNGHYFFVMQYVEGESLAEILSRRGKLSVNESLPIIKQCLAGLGAVHQRGLIHRDIKPGNILIDRQSRKALLTDFGIVKSDMSEAHLTVTGSIVGTVDCIAPEQARGSKIDCRADLYAVGILMYQMLSGKLPFTATSATSMMFQHAYEPPPPLSQVAATVPAELAEIVMKLLAKNPDDRYQSADDVLNALEQIDSTRQSVPQQTRVIEAPDWDMPPQVTNTFLRPPRETLLRRLKNTLFFFFRDRAPQLLESLQTTSQQADGAIAHYQRQREYLADLLKQARATASDLAEQQKSAHLAAQEAVSRSEKTDTLTARQKALKEKQDNEQTVAELAQLAAEQDEQTEQIEMQLAQLDAKLVQLRSQRDALNARMNVADARLGVDKRQTKWAHRKKLTYAALLILLVVLSAVLIHWVFHNITESPVGTWQAIDFIQHIEDFQSNHKSFQGSLFLQKLVFEDNGILWWTNNNGGPYKHQWKSRQIDPDHERPASFVIRNIDGIPYLFMEWISGDVTLRGQKPQYYVLKKVTDPEPKSTYYAYIVSFRPVQPFTPQTARELLDAFNQNHPSGVRTHHYRTKINDDQLVGYICVDNKNDAQAIEEMLKQNNALEFIYAKAVTQQAFDEYCQLKQVSLSSSSSSPSIYNQISERSVIVIDDVPVEGIVINHPDCTAAFVQSLLGPPVRIDSDGKMLRYTNYGFDLWFSGNRHLSEVHLNQGFAGKLDTGISMGSTMQDVFDTYGTPIETIQTNQLSGQNQERILRQKEDISRIFYGQHGLIFWFRGDSITQIVSFRGKFSQD
jgi:serine/threonine protein kinase